jgi:hypothetical protein
MRFKKTISSFRGRKRREKSGINVNTKYDRIYLAPRQIKYTKIKLIIEYYKEIVEKKAL